MQLIKRRRKFYSTLKFLGRLLVPGSFLVFIYSRLEILDGNDIISKDHEHMTLNIFESFGVKND
jgi:hypothetical protein